MQDLYLGMHMIIAKKYSLEARLVIDSYSDYRDGFCSKKSKPIFCGNTR